MRVYHTTQVALPNDPTKAVSRNAWNADHTVGPYNAGVTGAQDRTLDAKLLDYLTVNDFGAVGDGVADDTAAINAAFAAVRASISGALTSDGVASVIVAFAPGVYRVTDTLNLTGLTAFNLVIEGNGATIHGVVAGKPVVDMLGSNCYAVRNLNIIGDSTSVPTYGIQRGRIGAANAGKVSMDNVSIDGHFTVAAYYNLAGEVDVHKKCQFTNRRTGGVVLIEDGGNFQNITSAFVTQTCPVGVEQSFNEQLWLSCEFRNLANGVVIAIKGNQERHNFVNCYARTDGNVICTTDRSDRVRDLWMDIHIEASTVTKLLVVDNVNPAANIVFSGFKYVDHQPFATSCLIDTTGTTRTVLFDCFELDIGDPFNTIPVFGSTAVDAFKLLVSGTIKWASAKVLNLANCYFNGIIYCRSNTTFTHTLGTYQIIRRPDGPTNQVNTLKGTLQVFGTSTGVAPANWWNIEGQEGTTSPIIRVDGSATDLSARIRGKGTGGVRLEDGANAAKVEVNTTGVGFYGTAPVAKPTITGSRGGNAALADLLTKLASQGLITDGTSA